MRDQYREQVALLIRIIPYIARESCFALKGGTAINLFYRDLPRLSVDLDLVYLGFEGRDEAMIAIQSALERIAQVLRKAGLKALLQGDIDNQKLIVSNSSTAIKVEPNYTLRGHVFPVQTRSVSPLVEREFGYAEMQLISPAELFGGKICAALDRQHPRDLFDIAQMFSDPSPIPDLIAGFAVMLCCHNRPPLDLLDPVEKNQTELFDKEFSGMTDEPFSYADHRVVFRRLVNYVHAKLVPFKTAFVQFYGLASELSSAFPPRIDRLPAIQWKRQNLEVLRTKNPRKFEEHLKRIVTYFETCEDTL